jgi:hypothetical protein
MREARIFTIRRKSLCLGATCNCLQILAEKSGGMEYPQKAFAKAFMLQFGM